MFAAGRQTTGIDSSQNVDAGDDAETEDDWLMIGKSFSSDKDAKQKAIEPSKSALQVYKDRHGKRHQKEKRKHKEKKRYSQESTAVTSYEARHLSKHKKKKSKKKSESKRDSKKRRRSWSSASSSNEDDSYRPRQRSRSRSRSLNDKQETRVLVQSANDVVAHRHGTTDDLFEFDCTGDRNNQFFGSTYVHDQPLYQLATHRNLLTGARVIQTRSKYTTSKPSEEKQHSGRYFSLQARKMEGDVRHKRLYLAYSEKRLARAATKDELSHKSSQLHQTNTTVSRSHEMAFIPLDPVRDVDELVGSKVISDDTLDETLLLTDGQSVEQHLVDRSRMLNAAVTASPHIINHWLDLIAFQEQTIHLHTKSKKISPAIKASIREKQAAILARALASNPQSRELHRVKLNMSLQAQANDDNNGIDSFERQIEKLLAGDSTNSELWLRLLQSRHQSFGTFSMQSVRDLYARILTVLRTQSGRNTIEMAPAASSSSDKTEAEPDRADELSIVLLDFHFLMCVFEKKAGYVERSIAQLQALLDFSAMVDACGSKESHLELLQKFALRWNDESAARFGDQRSGETGWSIGPLTEEPPQISNAAFQDYLKEKSAAIVDHINPPSVVCSDEHKQSLLSSSATYRRLSRTTEVRKSTVCEKKASEIDASQEGSIASDNSEVESKQGSTLVYSNLHGYRISVDEADDTKEYERILSELRGTEVSLARRTRLLKKEKRKDAVLATTKSQVEDQRANYDPVKEDDPYVQWLRLEEVQTQLQWAPLQCSNPLHQDLIEQQPDRATLTEEIQPFLFPVPMAHRWRLVAELLHICGVDWRGEYSWKTSLPAAKSMYADSCADYELLVAPIQSVLNSQAKCSKTRALFLTPFERKMLLENAHFEDIAVSQDVLNDPSKVTFVRRVFAQSLDVVHNVDHNFQSNLKCLWIGFEAKVARQCSSKEQKGFARRLSQSLAQKSTNGDTDFDVLHAYAKLELALDNERQVRRVCENTLKSLGDQALDGPSLARIVHRFVFLHARLDLWPSISDRNKTLDRGDHRILQCLYTLWNVWQLVQRDGKATEAPGMTAKSHRKQSRESLERLLKSDPSTGSKLIARYRAELKFAVEHCTASNSASHERDKTIHRSHDQSRCWASYCLHNLALVVYAYHGFEAACHEYREALATEEHRTCPQNEWTWTCFLELLQQHQVSGLFPNVAPRVWRSLVNEAVEKFPSNELFLRLFVDSEMGNTVSQVHRKYFEGVEKRRRRHCDSPKLVDWLFALLCEFCRVERAATVKELVRNDDKGAFSTCCLFHRWGMDMAAVDRIRHLFECMVNQIQTKGSALGWGLYMRFEVAMGKVNAAKKVFYRGIAACAWSKAFYMDGLRVMRAYLSDDECQELVNFMEAKELNLRVDTEVLTLT